MKQKERALLRIVKGHNEDVGGFAGFRAWLEARLMHGEAAPNHKDTTRQAVDSNTNKRKPEDVATGITRRSKRIAALSLDSWSVT